MSACSRRARRRFKGDLADLVLAPDAVLALVVEVKVRAVQEEREVLLG